MISSLCYIYVFLSLCPHPCVLIFVFLFLCSHPCVLIFVFISLCSYFCVPIFVLFFFYIWVLILVFLSVCSYSCVLIFVFLSACTYPCVFFLVFLYSCSYSCKFKQRKRRVVSFYKVTVLRNYVSTLSSFNKCDIHVNLLRQIMSVFLLYLWKAIKENSATHKRVLEAYKMMLNFYGMELVNDIDGRIQRCKNWTTRYSHLNKYVSALCFAWRSTHNTVLVSMIYHSNLFVKDSPKFNKDFIDYQNDTVLPCGYLDIWFFKNMFCLFFI